MFKIKVKGVDEMISKLDDLSKKVKNVSGKHSISLSVLLSPDFIKKNTKFQDVDEFFEKGGFSFKNSKEFEKIDEAKLDGWVKSNSKFNSWKEMLESASAEHVKDQIGL